MADIPSKIFIDGGEPEETKLASEILLKHTGRPLDGQTTNPTLIAKNLLDKIQNPKSKSISNSKFQDPKISEEEALGEYKRIVQEMSKIIPKGSISIQVFADQETSAEEMLEQANERNKWIPNASIKFPCTKEGLNAAGTACLTMPINITLVFSQDQAAAVYEATLNPTSLKLRGAQYPIFISPFVGRLDDRGENGMDVVKNIKKMYENGDNHVEVLTASVRNVDHILYAIYLKSDIITIPFKVFKLWADGGFQTPDENYRYERGNLKEIPYRENIVLGRDWQEYDLHHDLTMTGIERFYFDWMNLFNK